MDSVPRGPGISSSRARLALAAGRAANGLSRRLGKGAGGVIGGDVAQRLHPSLLAVLAEGRDIALVTGTNGKSTTTELLATALAVKGPVAHNQGGSNMNNGLVVALDSARDAPTAALEVDEAFLGPIVAATRPRSITLLNLSREYTRGVSYKREAQHWRDVAATLGEDVTVVANADDPLVVWAVEPAPRVVWVAGGLWWKEDAQVCRTCLAPFVWEDDHFHCEQCGLKRPEPDWRVDDDAIHGPGVDLKLDVSLPGRANRLNALFALATAHLYDVDLDAAAAGITAVIDVDGRYRLYDVDGRVVRLHMVKNSSGWNEVFDLFAADPGAGAVFAVDRFGLTGRDTATIWDSPAELLRGRHVVASGERREDVALRLQVAGASVTTMADHLDAIRCFPAGPVNVVANYSAFNSLKRRLGP